MLESSCTPTLVALRRLKATLRIYKAWIDLGKMPEKGSKRIRSIVCTWKLLCCYGYWMMLVIIVNVILDELRNAMWLVIDENVDVTFFCSMFELRWWMTMNYGGKWWWSYPRYTLEPYHRGCASNDVDWETRWKLQHSEQFRTRRQLSRIINGHHQLVNWPIVENKVLNGQETQRTTNW